MKKVLLAGFSILLALLVNEPNRVFAETPGVSETKPGVSEQLMQKFRESFPDAEQVNWQESNNWYIVSFTEQGVLNRITYKQTGEFVSSFRNYGEHDLPYYLIESLKKKYPGQKIIGVTEITAISDIAYFVKLEGPKYWISVRLNGEGDSFIVESYRKAS
jgi:hypothetical protein